MSTSNFDEKNYMERLHYAVNEIMRGNWAELSRKTGLNTSTTHNVRTGGEPKLITIYRICSAMNVSLDWLTTGEGEMLKGKMEKQKWDAVEERRGEYKANTSTVNMLEGLTERQKMLVLADIEEKKQLNAMAATIAKLKGGKQEK